MRTMGIMLVVLLAGTHAQADDWYTKSVKSVEWKVQPAQAKPGQTVTFQLTVNLQDGYHTYPIIQPEKAAASFVNKITYPNLEHLVFVGQTIDPEKPDVKAEPELGILELRTYHGTVAYRRIAVVSPKAKPGEIDVTLKTFRLNVCDKENCFPPKTLTPSTRLKILDGPAVAVDPAYLAEVNKALGTK